MEKELLNTFDKELLLKDLCARLPYHVRLKVWLKDRTTEEGFLDLKHNYGDVLRDAFYYNEIIDIKPYLFPLSSMTEEQSKVYHELIGGMFGTSALINFEILEDFFHKNHLDHRGLIPMGLSIDATGLNIY